MDIPIRHVLTPVDFSQTSRRALHVAVAVARRHSAEVTALHVTPHTLPPLSALAASLSGALEGHERERLRHDLLEELQLFVAPVANGTSVSCAVEEGNIAGTILQQIESRPYDLLVVGTHGHDQLEKLVLGSVTEKVLHRAPCPVLTVPSAPENAPPPEGAFRRILCPVDFSPATAQAVVHAVALARESDGRVILLHAVEGLFDLEPPDLRFDVSEYVRLATARARERLRCVVAEEDAPWLEGEPLVVRGTAHREILRVAAESAADLIVMGVHGRSGLNLLLFGSTARHVVRDAACPVLTLRPGVSPLRQQEQEAVAVPVAAPSSAGV
jgi:nucleotide-binding universal stress UspA family protein